MYHITIFGGLGLELLGPWSGARERRARSFDLDASNVPEYMGMSTHMRTLYAASNPKKPKLKVPDHVCPFRAWSVLCLYG